MNMLKMFLIFLPTFSDRILEEVGVKRQGGLFTDNLDADWPTLVEMGQGHAKSHAKAHAKYRACLKGQRTHFLR